MPDRAFADAGEVLEIERLRPCGIAALRSAATPSCASISFAAGTTASRRLRPSIRCAARSPSASSRSRSYTARYDGPRTDFRETIAWHSRLVTDATGKAQIGFFLSDAVTSFKVTAEGAGGGHLGHGETLVQANKPVSLAVKLPLEVSAGRPRPPAVTIRERDRFSRTAPSSRRRSARRSR